MRFFRNADDYADPLRKLRFFRSWFRSRPPSIEPVPKATVYPRETIYENKAHTTGNLSEVRPYSSQLQEISYPESHTPMSRTALPGMPEGHIERYNEDVDRALIEHTLVRLFGVKVLDSGLEDMDFSDNWVDSVTDEGVTILDVPGLVSGIPLEAADDMSETDPTVDFTPDNMLDDPSSGAESPAVEQMLDDLLDDTIDDMPLEDILDEPMADEMPENDMQEMDADMDPMEDTMEMNPYML